MERYLLTENCALPINVYLVDIGGVYILSQERIPKFSVKSPSEKGVLFNINMELTEKEKEYINVWNRNNSCLINQLIRKEISIEIFKLLVFNENREVSIKELEVQSKLIKILTKLEK